MKNNLKWALVLAGMLVSAVCLAQAPDYSAQVKEKIRAFDFLIGTWTGEGWIYTPEGTRETSTVKEVIGYNAGGTVLQLEGLGTDEDGKIVHEALGILSYDLFQQRYKMHSFIGRGMQTEAKVELKEPGKMVWWFSAGPNTMRYTLEVKDGIWTETGEMSPDGETWRPFFGMTLTKSN